MDDFLKPVQDKMSKSVDAMKNEFTAIRAGRANPAVLDKLRVDYYGTPTPISQMAAINVAEARLLTIQPWDVSTIKLIEKAILTSDVGINPQNDGRIIRLAFPQLTEDSRRDIAKQIKQMAEGAKVSVRNTRRDTLEKLKKAQKAGEITEDDLKVDEKELQDITDKFVKEIDALATAKEKDIMEL